MASLAFESGSGGEEVDLVASSTVWFRGVLEVKAWKWSTSRLIGRHKLSLALKLRDTLRKVSLQFNSANTNSLPNSVQGLEFSILNMWLRHHFKVEECQGPQESGTLYNARVCFLVASQESHYNETKVTVIYWVSTFATHSARHFIISKPHNYPAKET